MTPTHHAVRSRAHLLLKGTFCSCHAREGVSRPCSQLARTHSLGSRSALRLRLRDPAWEMRTLPLDPPGVSCTPRVAMFLWADATRESEHDLRANHGVWKIGSAAETVLRDPYERGLALEWCAYLFAGLLSESGRGRRRDCITCQHRKAYDDIF